MKDTVRGGLGEITLRPVYRLELQYIGTGFHGWSSQPGLPTLLGALEEAFRVSVGGVPRLEVAGRTDAGVHARRQVVSIHPPVHSVGGCVGALFPEESAERCDLAGVLRSLNALTPPEIAFYALERAPCGFDARRQALSRRYRYFVSAWEDAGPMLGGFVWRIPVLPRIELLQRLARMLTGAHDFGAFTPRKTEHMRFKRRVLTARWEQRNGIMWLDIEADSFMRHMVRTLVGTMVEVARGRFTEAEFGRLLEGASRTEAGVTAPAQGLFLWDVRYPDWCEAAAQPPLLSLPCE